MKNGYNAQHRVKGQLRQNCISAHKTLSILLLQTARGPLLLQFRHIFQVECIKRDLWYILADLAIGEKTLITMSGCGPSFEWVGLLSFFSFFISSFLCILRHFALKQASIAMTQCFLCFSYIWDELADTAKKIPRWRQLKTLHSMPLHQGRTMYQYTTLLPHMCTK